MKELQSHKDFYRFIATFLTAGALWLWGCAKGIEWWGLFIGYCRGRWDKAENCYVSDPFVSWEKWLISPIRFPELVADFLEGVRNVQK